MIKSDIAIACMGKLTDEFQPMTNIVNQVGYTRQAILKSMQRAAEAGYVLLQMGSRGGPIRSEDRITLVSITAAGREWLAAPPEPKRAYGPKPKRVLRPIDKDVATPAMSDLLRRAW